MRIIVDAEIYTYNAFHIGTRYCCTTSGCNSIVLRTRSQLKRTLLKKDVPNQTLPQRPGSFALFKLITILLGGQ